MPRALRKLCLHLPLAALLLSYLFANIKLTEYRDQASALLFWSVRLGFLLALFLETGVLFYFTVIRERQRSGYFYKASVVFYALLISFLMLEAGFLFFPQSDNVGYSLAAQTWHRLYWGRQNEFGYRDGPVSAAALQGKRTVFVVGDSFTAGWGIQARADRFSDLLQARLPPSYRVVNLGANGSDTRGEFRRLKEFPFRPDILILQYFGNDIEEILPDRGALAFHPYQNFPRLFRPLLMGSYLLNYVYWRFPQADLEGYSGALLAAYRDPGLLARHLADLQRFVNFGRHNHILMIAVVFPFLRDLQASEAFTVPVERFFVQSGVAVIDVGNLVKNIPPAQRVVNRNDGHASKLVQRVVAEELYRAVMSGELTPEDGKAIRP